MKATSILSTATLLGCAAAAHNAYIWTIDAGTAKHDTIQSSSVSSNAASSIIARRRGVDGDRYLDTADEATLSDVNQFGGYQSPLFASHTDKAPEKILVKISGFDGAISKFSTPPNLWAPDATTNMEADFVAKVTHGRCEYNIPVSDKEGSYIVYSYSSEDECMSLGDASKSETIESILKQIPTAKEVSKGIDGLLQQLHHFAATSNIESTILVLPHTSQLKKANLVRRNEEPMEFAPAMSDLSNKLPPFTSSSTTANSTNTTHPLPSVIPLCFTSMDICTNTTNACSGHGSCYKAHAGCFKCRCGSTTVRQYKDGANKTVQWGGNACQKKDISVPFVLFASIGLLLATLIAGGIGMIYGMGSQELPSVLGAGVSGPRAQK